MLYHISLLFLQQNEKNTVFPMLLFLYGRLHTWPTNDYHKRVHGASLCIQGRYHSCFTSANRLCIQTFEIQEQETAERI